MGSLSILTKSISHAGMTVHRIVTDVKTGGYYAPRVTLVVGDITTDYSAAQTVDKVSANGLPATKMG